MMSLLNDEGSMDSKSESGRGGGGEGGDSASQQATGLSSIYPLPPMRYIKLYTDQNVRNRQTPPPPRPFPTNGQFLMFGQTISIDDTIIQSLESQGLRRLYPREYDHKRELKKINASILVNFLDLIDVLIRCPETVKREEKGKDLEVLFITMHHLINELRPHQARESIRVSLQVQKKQRMETTARLNKQIERVQEMIRSASDAISDQSIASIIHDTAPENFTSNKSDTMQWSSIDSKENVKPPLFTNGSLASATTAFALPNRSSNEENVHSAKMAKLDAVMCKLVDESF